MLRVLWLALQLALQPPFTASVEPLPQPLHHELTRTYSRGCPAPLTQMRVLTVSYWGFDDRAHTGQLIVNRDHASSLEAVFRGLYGMRFPIRHMRLPDAYGPKPGRPPDGDVTAALDCRQAVPSPCSGGSGTGSWSEHAYGAAIDLNPLENPYAGCGRTRDRAERPYLDRSRLRRGMVTPAVVALFRSIGWGWGGDWPGSTKDYMHFSASGH